MAEHFDRDAEDILRDARAHMNPTVYDRGRVSQKLASTRRDWDGQSSVGGGPLPDPFTPAAKIAGALKFASWKVIAGSVVGLMLATGAYVAIPSSSSSPATKRALPTVETPAEVPAQGHALAVAQQAVEHGESEAEAARVPAARVDEADRVDGADRAERKAPRSERAPRARRSKVSATRSGYGQQQATAVAANEGVAKNTDTAGAKDADLVSDSASDARQTPELATPEPTAPAAIAAPAPKPALDPLIEDLSLLKRAAEVLHRGDPRSAQSLLQEHARRFPKSDARFERHALAFAAACALGDTKVAEEHRATLLREAPRSALSARVRAGCGMSER